MAQSHLTSAFPQKKRIAHQAKGKAAASVPSTTSSAEKEILKQFDLTLEFGPCIGITRLERWERAEKHGLKPPQEVFNIIKAHSGDRSYTECLWSDYSTLG